MDVVEGTRARVPYNNCFCPCHYPNVDQALGVPDSWLCDPCQRANDRDLKRKPYRPLPSTVAMLSDPGRLVTWKGRRRTSADECIIEDRWHVCS